MIFLEKNKVLGVEVKHGFEYIKRYLEKQTRLEASGGKTRGSVGCACIAHLSFCFEET